MVRQIPAIFRSIKTAKCMISLHAGHNICYATLSGIKGYRPACLTIGYLAPLFARLNGACQALVSMLIVPVPGRTGTGGKGHEGRGGGVYIYLHLSCRS